MRCTRCATEDQFDVNGNCMVCKQSLSEKPTSVSSSSITIATHCHDCKKRVEAINVMLVTAGDKDVQVCKPCFAIREGGWVFENQHGTFEVYDHRGKIKRAYMKLKDAETYHRRCKAQRLRHQQKPKEKKFIPPSHFTPKPKQRALAELKPNYIGITYPDGPDAATWSGCGKGEHLLDEVISGLDHYLVCDACGLEIHISKIVTR